jgi:penicillin-binding protein 1A
MRLRNVFPDRQPISRLWIVLAWLAGGMVCTLAGLALAFRLWAPQVVLEYQASVAGTPSNTLIYAAGGELLATVTGQEDRHWVPLTRIHPFMQKAAVAIEDRRFFAHRGIDPVRLGGALWADLRSWAPDQGGSTITQQLVKLSLLSSERTLSRKLKELFMALALEQELPKLELLEAYLNKVYLGYGMYGIEKAAQGYFAKSADALTLNEAAFLAALIKKPEGYLQIAGPDPNPDTPDLPLAHMEPLVKRQKLVIESMYKLGWISDEDHEASQKERLRVLRPRPELGTAPYFVQQVLKELRDLLSVTHTSGRGYRVYTTLDLTQQRAAEAVVERLARENREASQAALVALEPHTGNVRALVGGVDFSRSQFNRATQALRQPGSAFKPIVYAAALEAGFSPVAVFHDEPVRFVWSGSDRTFRRTRDIGLLAAPLLPEGGLTTPEGEQVYEPRNYDGRYGLPAIRAQESEDAPDRRMTLGRALELSSNVIAVQLLDQLGMTPVVGLASRYNLTVRPAMGLCVALGCSEVSLITLTAAYGSFANGGERVQPVFIRSVNSSSGESLYVQPARPPEQVIGDWTAFQMRQLLTGTIERGTGQRARLGRPAGGKTGTNDGPRDTWFVGFTPELVAGVWIGNDDNRVMPSEVGGRSTARMWAEFMRAALAQVPRREYPEPTLEYVGQRICNLTGRIARTGCPDMETYYFARDNVPAELFADDGDDAAAVERVQAAAIAPLPVRPGSGSPAAAAAAQAGPRSPAGAPSANPSPSSPLGPGTKTTPASPSGPAPAASFGQRLREAFTPAPRAVPPE